MRIRLLVVGKTTDVLIQQLIEEYQNRLKHYTNFQIQYLLPKNKKGALNGSEIKGREADVILKHLPENATIILLDEKGKSYTSEAFAQFLQKRLNVGNKELVFCIGGAYGFDDLLYQRADYKLALSLMTFTHQMVRPIFVEQLYRAFTILKGEKYHH